MSGNVRMPLRGLRGNVGSVACTRRSRARSLCCRQRPRFKTLCARRPLSDFQDRCRQLHRDEWRGCDGVALIEKTRAAARKGRRGRRPTSCPRPSSPRRACRSARSGGMMPTAPTISRGGSNATNLGLARMARSSGMFTHSKLLWTAEWHIRDETYQGRLACW